MTTKDRLNELANNIRYHGHDREAIAEAIELIAVEVAKIQTSPAAAAVTEPTTAE